MALTRPSAAQLSSASVDFTDPLFRINKDQSGANDKDIGLVFERGSDTNVGLIWDESDDEFALINTTETGTTSGNVTISSYANLTIGSLTSAGLSYPSSDGTVGQVLSTDGSGNLTFISAAGSPGGSNTQIQFNNNGQFAGSANLTFDGTTLTSTGFSGPLSGNVTGNASTASAWATSRTITLGGDLTGNVSINGSADVTLTATVADDSHNHIISNVDGLQTALDGKAALSGATFTGDVTFNTGIVQSESKFESISTTVANTSETAIYNFPYATYGAAEFVITAVNGTNRHITKLLVTHNGTTAVATEYGSVFTSSGLASYDVSILSSNVQILATPTTSNTTFKIVSILIE